MISELNCLKSAGVVASADPCLIEGVPSQEVAAGAERLGRAELLLPGEGGRAALQQLPHFLNRLAGNSTVSDDPLHFQSSSVEWELVQNKFF